MYRRPIFMAVALTLFASMPAQAQRISTVAGDGYPGDCDNGALATHSCLDYPYGVGVDAAGNLYIADTGNNRIKKVGPDGRITIVAGNGEDDFCGDGGLATDACLSYPMAVVADPSGALFIADFGNGRIRRVSPSGIITTVAGNGRGYFCGDGGPAADACLAGPRGLALDAAGNLYIAEWIMSLVRKVDTAGIITTVAGFGGIGFCGDGGPAIDACLRFPRGVAVEASGRIVIADSMNHRLRAIDAAGTISTIAGSGKFPGFCGDGGPATSACLSYPVGVVADRYGRLFFSDAGNARVRQIDAAGTITTLVGNGSEYCADDNGDGGLPTNACLNTPAQLAMSDAGTLFVVEEESHRVRQVPMGLAPLTATKSLVPGCRSISGRVTLASPAGPGGARIMLASDDAHVSVPASVTIGAGKASTVFPIATSAVSRRTPVTITATGSYGAPRSFALTLRPIAPASVQLSPNPVTGGVAVTGTVTLECAAGPRNVTVTLSSGKFFVARPLDDSIKVLMGSTTASFAVLTSTVTATKSAAIKATAQGVTKSKLLIVNPGS